MRDPNRIPMILTEIEKVWKRNPDLRLGQIISNSTVLALTTDIFYMEDEELIENIKECYPVDRPGLWAKCTKLAPNEDEKDYNLIQGKWYKVSKINYSEFDAYLKLDGEAGEFNTDCFEFSYDDVKCDAWDFGIRSMVNYS